MTMVAKLEALLFVEGGEMKKTEVMRILDIDIDELTNISGTLTHVLSGHGITLVQSETTLALRSSQEVASFIKELHEKALEGDLGKAALETLSILFYKGSTGKSEIDYIRGVNSSTTIRALLVRGLIERSKNGSAYVYKPTINALSFLGITKTQDLPEFEKIRKELKEFEKDAKIMQD